MTPAAKEVHSSGSENIWNRQSGKQVRARQILDKLKRLLKDSPIGNHQIHHRLGNTPQKEFGGVKLLICHCRDYRHCLIHLLHLQSTLHTPKVLLLAQVAASKML